MPNILRLAPACAHTLGRVTKHRCKRRMPTILHGPRTIIWQYSSSRSGLRTHPWSSDQTQVQEADAYYSSRSKDHDLARSPVSLRLACTPLGNRPDKCAPG